MSGPGRFGAVVTAMVTPFDDDLKLDVDGAVALAKWLAQHGNDGLVLAGTTGESPTLSDDEKLTLWETVAGAVTIPVIAGSTGSDTAHDVAITKKVAGLGVAGILALCPYYSRPSQAGIAAHLHAVAEAARDLPVILYDIPVRTGRKIGREVLHDLLTNVPNVVGVKDAAANPAWAARLVADVPDVELYSGDDVFTLPLLAIGACGAISVAGHWTGRLQQRMFEAFWKGEVDVAREINVRLLPSFLYETGDDAPNPIPSKAMLRELGLPAGECRLPLGPAPAFVGEAARAIIADLGDDLG
jgi:4-hydroxy-tetrahydrodipicolinate synthase